MYLTSSTGGIQGINATQAQATELNVMADAGGEGGVIIDSANALLQGLYPPYNDTITLANGTMVSWGLNRAQLIPIETIEPEQDVWMEGWSDCSAWSQYLQDLYASSDFKEKASVANQFYQTQASVLGNRPLTLENGYNIFDFANVESIHNATLSPQLQPSLPEYRYWADYHESSAFANSDASHIANIAGQSILPPLLDGINQIYNSTDPLKLTYLAASYKPFLSLFAMMGLSAPLTTSLVDYASAAVFEVRSDATVTMRFRNGTDGDFITYPLFGSSSDSTPISELEAKLRPHSLDSLSSWCDKCSNSETRGCATLAQLNGTGGGDVEYASAASTTGRHHVSPVVAGVIGAMVTLAIAAVLLAAWLFFGGLVKRSRRSNAQASDNKQHAGAAARDSSTYEMPQRTDSKREGSIVTAASSSRPDAKNSLH